MKRTPSRRTRWKPSSGRSRPPTPSWPGAERTFRARPGVDGSAVASNRPGGLNVRATERRRRQAAVGAEPLDELAVPDDLVRTTRSAVREAEVGSARRDADMGR